MATGPISEIVEGFMREAIAPIVQSGGDLTARSTPAPAAPQGQPAPPASPPATQPPVKAPDAAPPAPAPAPAAAAPTPPVTTPPAPPTPPEEDYRTAPAPKDASGWDKWKANRAAAEEALQAKLKALETDRETFKRQAEEAAAAKAATGEVPADWQVQVKAKDDEIKALHERIMVLDVTADPRFQAYFQAKEAAVVARAKGIVGEEKGAELEKIMRTQDPEVRASRLEDFAAELPTLAQARLGAVLEAYESVAAERAAEVTKAENHKADRQAARTAQAAQVQKVIEATWTSEVAKLTDPKTGFAPVQRREGDSTWNAAAEKRLAEAKRLLLGQNIAPADAIRAAVHAACVPDMLRAYDADRAEWEGKIAKLEAQLASLSAAQPGAGLPPTPRPPTPGVPDIKPGMMPWQIMQEAARATISSARGG